MAAENSLRVLIVGYGGDITFIDRLLIGLSRKPVEITITTSSRSTAPQLTGPNVHWLWLPSDDDPLFLRLLRSIRSLLRLRKPGRSPWLGKQMSMASSLRDKLHVFLRYAPFLNDPWDVIYIPWNSTAIDYIGLFALGIPIILSCRGSQVNIRPHTSTGGSYAENLRQTFNKAARVHCVSRAILDEAVDLGLTHTKARVIHPAVDPDFFEPGPARQENTSLLLVTTGSLIWRKGYEYLLMALRGVLERGVDARLEIIGEGYERERIRFTISDLGLNDRVKLLGRLDPEQVKQKLQQADVFVLSSLSEGISNAVLEGMSCALPVVTTDSGGMHEAVTEGVEGFVVPPRDAHAMAEVILRLANNSSLRSQMGLAARDHILRDFRLDAQVDDFYELIIQASHHAN